MVAEAFALERPARDDLNQVATRADLSAPLVSLFFKLAARWGLSQSEQMRVLGGVSRQTLHNWATGKVPTLARDQIERLSLLLGIHKALRLIFSEDEAARRWFDSANRDAPFGGVPPRALATRGGIGDLVVVRAYLDAWRGVR
jgi:hypothetical protein